MKQILLISHGDFAKGMLDSISIIAGKQENVEALTITMDTNLEEFKQAIRQKRTDHASNPMILLTDIAGGSTTQSALSVYEEFPYTYLICGLNLGLVLELLFLELGQNDEENHQMLREIIERNRASISLLEHPLDSSSDMDSDEL